MQLNLILQLDFRNALQGLAQNLRFESQLALVRNVLIVATAAALEIRAARLDSIGRSLDQTRDVTPSETGLLLPYLGFHLLSRQHKWNKYSHAAPVETGSGASQPIAAVDQFFNGEKHD